MKVVFIEDLPGLYAETFIIADSNKFKSMGASVEHLYLSELKISWHSVIKNAINNPIKFIYAINLIVRGLSTPRRLISNTHTLLIFLSNYYYLEESLKNASLRCHFLAKRFTFGYFCNLYFGTKYSGVAHAKDIFEWDNSIPIKISSASYIDCISNYNIGYINGKTNFRFASKLRLSRNSVLLSTFDQYKYKEQGYTKKPIRFISVCRLVEKKGLSDCLKFLEALSDKHDIVWSIIGDGPCHHTLLKQAENSKIASRVEFFGQQSQKFVSDALAQSDYFILLPLNAEPKKLDMDGIPTVYVEALNHNIPVITTDVSGIPELIINGINGVLFKSNTPTSTKVEIFLENHRDGFKTNKIKRSIDFFQKTGH